MRLQGKFAAIVSLAVALTCTIGAPVYANSLAHEQNIMSQLKQEANQTNAEISRQQAKASSLRHSIADTETSLGNVRVAIATNHRETQMVLTKLHTLSAEIQTNQVKLNGDKNALVGQLRSMYEGGPMQYLNVLFGSSSFHDFLSRLSLLEIIAQRQNVLIHQVKLLQRSIQDERGHQQLTYMDLEQKDNQLQTFEVAQRILEGKNQTLLADVNSTIQTDTRRNVTLESQIQLTQAQINQIQQETQKAQQLMSDASYVQQQRASLAQVSSTPIITYAESFMGTPYVWGGTSPSGFDCSGFVQYVFSHYGVDLNRTSEDQFAEGVPVSSSNLQPGDLVFFSTYAPGATHVGIYMGNGMMIDAEDRGVTIDSVFNSYWGPKYIGARQIIQ